MAQQSIYSAPIQPPVDEQPSTSVIPLTELDDSSFSTWCASNINNSAFQPQAEPLFATGDAGVLEEYDGLSTDLAGINSGVHAVWDQGEDCVHG